MNRHPFRWPGLIMGLVYLAAAGTWAGRQQDLLTRQQFSYALSAVLIVLGSLGVIATFWRPRSSTLRTTTDLTTTTEEDHHEAPDPQS